MRNDVRTLIASLTTERDSIDRAITALQAMNGSAVPVKTTPRRGRRKGYVMTAEHKARLSEAQRARFARLRTDTGAITGETAVQ